MATVYSSNQRPISMTISFGFQAQKFTFRLQRIHLNNDIKISNSALNQTNQMPHKTKRKRKNDGITFLSIPFLKHSRITNIAYDTISLFFAWFIIENWTLILLLSFCVICMRVISIFFSFDIWFSRCAREISIRVYHLFGTSEYVIASE